MTPEDHQRPGVTPSATVGPYLSIGLTWNGGADLVPAATADAITIDGVLTDGAGAPVPDGLIEIWQADRAGRFNHPDDPRGGAVPSGALGFGRCPTDSDGRFAFRTVKPGPLPTGDGRTEAPHIDVSVFARGLLDRLVTRIYFADEAEANAADPVLVELGGTDRDRLLAVPAEHRRYRWDICLQGDLETPFFAV
jgi:protocatechuate 3,4-dioxygenase alpha subunit